jgi:polysaccharide pyruvyl transferase WcaK-like protein
VVTSKLHGAITSHVYQVPALLFCYQSKCADFLNDNELPGPREENPATAVCIDTVRSLLRESSPRLIDERAAERYAGFKDFLQRSVALRETD